jgi:streptomycin 6-kinase
MFMDIVKIDIPQNFIEFLRTRFGSEADVWLKGIPDIVSKKLEDWNLTLDSGQPLYGAMGLVFFCRKGEESLALKVSWRDALTESENKALKLWNGKGAVRLLEYDSENHVLLMERLTTNSLEDMDIVKAGIEAGRLIRMLGVECREGFPKLYDRARTMQKELLDRNKQISQNEIDIHRVVSIIAKQEKSLGQYLSHGDLYYLNVLQSLKGEWKAIDPKPMIGDLEFSIPELMWSRVDELKDDSSILAHLERIVESGNMDRQKAISWTIARAADYYFWGLENGLTDDPARCLRLYKALISEA